MDTRSHGPTLSAEHTTYKVVNEDNDARLGDEIALIRLELQSL